MNHFPIEKSDEETRRNSIIHLVPGVFKGEYKTVLNIGANAGRFSFGEDFRAAGYEITVLELYQVNVDSLKKLGWVKNAFCGDIRTFTTQEKYDVIFWWHGPEHVYEKELPPILQNLEKMCSKVVILGCPWGLSTADPTHISHYDYGTFEKLGYTVDCLGEKNCFKPYVASGMVGVKYVS
jgi:hypothetical protein